MAFVQGTEKHAHKAKHHSFAGTKMSRHFPFRAFLYLDTISKMKKEKKKKLFMSRFFEKPKIL